MKKRFFIFMIFIFLCTSTILGNTNQFKAGKYIGEGKGYAGKIKIEVSTSNNKIEKIEISESKETVNIGGTALESMIKQVIEHQNIAIDSIVGATKTYEGFKQALEDALKKTGVNMENISTPIKKELSTNTEILKTDVVVVGGGGAGLTAALFAAENGANVILIEKTGNLGGATLMSAGIIPATGTRQQIEAKLDDSVDNFQLDIFRAANYSQNKELVETVAAEAKTVIEWLESLDVKFKLITNALYYGQSNYRMHIAEGSGVGMTQKIIDAVNRNSKIKVMTLTSGTGLIIDNEKVIGLKAKSSSGQIYDIQSAKVILATSGFASNKEMLKKYIPEIVNAYPLTAPGATGEGIIWGQELGAQIKNMHAYQGHGVFNLKTKSSMDLSILSKGGILVNKSGKRFTNEIMGYSELTPHVVNQTDATSFMIFNETVAKNTKNFENYKGNGIVLEGKTVETLAKAMNVDEKELIKTFNIYKDGITKGEDVFNRTKLPRDFEGPYYAIEITGDLRHTQGGLVITVDGEVKKENGEIIPNLYAAGGVSEGFSSAGGPNYMSGNGLLQAFVFGRRAGISAAKSIAK
ncbi:flavocytochrome c [Fusobacterium sp. PH5-44]|uniref:flavocytochrome c n=1 Tax=unclassified Fusobacterium TaxID=2648384 RepID=UPI003D252F01